MRLRDGLLGLVTGVSGFIIVGVLVTEAAATYIAFSLMIGLPAGVIGGLVLWSLTYSWLGDQREAARHRGMTIAAFGSLFLVIAIAAVVFGNLRNSQALPIAGVVSVVGAGGLALYLRWRDRPVSSTDH